MKILFPKNKKPALPGISSAANYVKHVAAGLKLPKKAIICPISSLTKYVTSHSKWKKYTLKASVSPEVAGHKYTAIIDTDDANILIGKYYIGTAQKEESK